MTSNADLPEVLVPLSWLVGTWRGLGVGGYPTIEDFQFGQEIVVTNDGRQFLTYRSRSWLLDEAGNEVRPLGTETGFWRLTEGGEVEVMLSHPTGIIEIWLGAISVTEINDTAITGARVELRTDVVARTETAKPYTAGHRLYGLVEGRLLWAFDMAAMGQPLTSHLSGTLNRA